MASEELAIGTRLGNYELIARIGEGGMGTVYAAVHVGLGKRVAIKTLRSELAADPDVRARFVREGKAAVAVRHPNVVDIDDVGVYQQVPYLVMELLDGENLHSLITRRERLGIQETADIVVPVLSAMAESHRAGVVHRDLKPDNIFLARGAGGLPVPKVLDFGISKLRETQSLGLTGDNALLGTPYYMAPEQASSARDVDARSDLYAIGVILYHAVTGRVPFAGASLAQVIGQILHAAPVPLRECYADIPAAFEAIVLCLMEKDPARRYQDARSLGQALLPFASERIALTYLAEFEAAAMSVATRPALAPTVASTTTLSSAARSVETTARVPSSASRRASQLALVALALIGAALAFWPRAPQTETTIQPAAATTPVVEALPAPTQLPSVPDLPPPPAAPISEPAAPLQPSAPQVLPQMSAPKEKPKAKPHKPQPTSPKPTAATQPKPELPKPAPAEDVWGNRK